MKSLIALIAICLCIAQVATAQQQDLHAQPILGVDNTIAPNTANAALTWWDKVMAANDGTATGPSVKTVVEALGLLAEWSSDGASWHATHQSNDAWLRLRIRATDAWLTIPLGSTTTPTPLTGTELVALLTALTGNDRLPITAVDITGLTVAWADLRDIPDFASRWPTLSEIPGFEAKLRELVETWGLSIPEPPHWHRVSRQWLRVGSAYSSLALNSLVLGSATFSIGDAPNDLPSGLALVNGIISGTPDTEEVKFVDIIATNSDGSSTLRVPFIVLRKASFSTVYQNLEGLSVNGDDDIVAIQSNTGRVFSWDKVGVVDDAAGIVMETDSAFNPLGTTGFTWNDTTDKYVVIAGTQGRDTNNGVGLYSSSGNYESSNFPRQIEAARGISWDGGTGYWLTARFTGGVFDGVMPLNASLQPQSNRVNFASTVQPRGVQVQGGNLYVVDDTDNKVLVRTTAGVTVADREFNLASDNSEPRGITFLDGYFYVIEAGQASVNDTIFIYPSFEKQDISAPEIEKIELLSRGPFNTGNIIRPKVTFTGPVDVSPSARLLLNVGSGPPKQAIPVDGQAGTTLITADLTNQTTIFFYYEVQGTDVDADGLSTPLFPFLATGSITPHDDNLAAHSLVSVTSAYRVVPPGGVNALVPNAANAVNSVTQPDWNQTDTTALNFIRNKPKDLTGFPNTASLQPFQWVTVPDLVTYQGSGTRYNQITSFPPGGWNTSETITAGQTLLVRVLTSKLPELVGIYAIGSGYEKDLSHLTTDTDTWHAYTGIPGQYSYFARITAPTANITVTTAQRKFPYAYLDGVPIAPAPDWDEDNSASPNFIANKPFVAASQHGTLAFKANQRAAPTTEIPPSETRSDWITLDSTVLDDAEDYDANVHLILRGEWRAKDNAGDAAIDIQLDVDDDAPPGHNYFTQTYTGIAENTGANYTAVTITKDIPHAVRAYQIDIVNQDSTVAAELGTWTYRITLSNEQPLTAGESITIADGKVFVKDDGITDAKLQFADRVQPGQVVINEEGRIKGGYHFDPEVVTSHPQMRLAVTTGAPTLTQAAALTYTNQIEPTGILRTGRTIILRSASGTSLAGYGISFGTPTESNAGSVGNRILLDNLTLIGTQGGFEYRHSPGKTIHVDVPVNLFRLSPYAAQQVRDLVHLAGGDTSAPVSGLTNITGTAPINVSGTGTTRNVSLPDDTLTASKLLADTDVQEKAFRDALDLEEMHEVSISFTNQGTAAHETLITLPTALLNEATSRPLEVQLMATVTGRQTGSMDVYVQIRRDSASGTRLTGGSAISVDQAPKSVNLRGMIPPGVTNVAVLFTRISSTGFYDGTAVGRIKVGTAADNVYVHASGFDGNLTTTDDTVQEIAQKLDDLEVGGSPINHVASVSLTLTNFQSTAPQNDATVTEKAVNFASLGSSSQLGYTHYTMTFEGSGVGSRNGTASLYFIATGDDEATVTNRYYLLTDAKFGSSSYPPTDVATTLDYAGSVVIPIAKNTGKVVLVRTSASATGVLNFATSTLKGIRNTPDDPNIIHIPWTPTKISGGLTVTISWQRVFRIGDMVFISFIGNANRSGAWNSEFIYWNLPYANGDVHVSQIFSTETNPANITAVCHTNSGNRFSLAIVKPTAAAGAVRIYVSGFYYAKTAN